MNDDLLPISLVAHSEFCARRTWLEAQGESVPSVNIETGTAAHARVDARADERSMQRRSVDVSSQRLGIVGRCDVVSVEADGGVRVVEFKTAPQRRSLAVTPAQRLQLALQGQCLRDMGQRVDGYGVYFVTSRRLVPVELQQADFEHAEQQVYQTRSIVQSQQAPKPLVDDPRCTRCSHAGVCLPDERQEQEVRRRVLVRDPDSSVLHLTTPGSRAFLRSGRVHVVKGDESLAELPIERVDAVVVHGNVDLSSALIRELLWRKSQILWASGRGSLVGYASTVRSPNGGPRISQHVRSAGGDMGLAGQFISAKIANQGTIMRRYSRGATELQLRRLRVLQRAAVAAPTVPELLGVEGEAAALYFHSWRHLIRQADWALALWPGREGRGALDPINIALNLVYGLLSADVTRAVIAAGLDPHAGFVHSSSRNKPALSLDLMEEFRPVVADAVVLTALNNGELREDMFTDVLGGWRLREAGRKALVAGYERRVAQEFKHPVFGYQVTWRRAMEVQARMVLGVIDGTQPSYVGIRVR